MQTAVLASLLQPLNYGRGVETGPKMKEQNQEKKESYDAPERLRNY